MSTEDLWRGKAILLKAAGSQTAVAKAIGKTPQAVQQWRSVPPKYVIPLERAFGVPRYVQRPDIYPPEEAA